MNETLLYYNQHADAFTADTVSVDFTETQDRFLQYMPEGALILDFGCGAGRDTRCFLAHGYRVDAVDGSEAMCRAAGSLTGIPVRQMLFQELAEIDHYDGIWACASVLHLPTQELTDVLARMIRALKAGGVMYLSFKYGNYEGERNGRYFTDLTEERFRDLLKSVREEELLTDSGEFPVFWITGDVRPGRSGEKWLNILLKKRQPSVSQ